IPQQPAKKRCSIPSRSTYCDARNRTSAWAMVICVTWAPVAPEATRSRRAWASRPRTRGATPRSPPRRSRPRVSARAATPRECRPLVEVVDGHSTSAPNLERRQSGGAARLVREPGAGGPKERRRGDGVQVELISREVHVWRLGLAIEEERKAVRRIDLAEDDRRPQK